MASNYLNCVSVADKVYTGKEKVDETSVSEKIVIELFRELLDKGRTLYTDNWYTSVTLAQRKEKLTWLELCVKIERVILLMFYKQN